MKARDKHTEVGVIPVDWSVVDHVSFIDGDRGSHYPGATELSASGDCLFLDAGNVTKRGFRFDECRFITAQKVSDLSHGKMKRGDVVLTTRGTLGNLAYYDGKVSFDYIRINS